MRRADRLLDIVARLKGKRVVRADQLAAALEVSVRTVYRDIATLQAQGLPIEGQAGVGYLVRENLNLPPLTLDHDQLDAIALGLSLVEGIGDNELVAAARAARAKIDAAWTGMPTPPPSERRLLTREPRHRKAPPAAALIRRALRERRIIRFSYANEAGHRSERSVRPLALRSFHAGWLLIAWCNDREAFRVFRLDRMRECQATEFTFPVEPDRELAAYLASAPRSRD